MVVGTIDKSFDGSNRAQFRDGGQFNDRRLQIIVFSQNFGLLGYCIQRADYDRSAVWSANHSVH